MKVNGRMVRRISAAVLVVLPLAVFAAARAAVAANPLVIMVDHVDPDNQQPFPPFNRLFEYTDFFSRSVTVHQGDTINFQTQPFSFHIVALAKDEAAARQAYPSLQLDTDDHAAMGTGLPKIIFGEGNFPVTGGSTHGGGVISTDSGKGPPACGALQFNQAPCHFRGGDDVEILGPTVGWNLQQQPTTIDQHVVIDAPPGKYAYFDMLHPGMRGTLTVVAPGKKISTQAEIDAASAAQFADDRAKALAVEAALNKTPENIGPPGQRHLVVFNGISAANDHVELDEMLPNRPLDVVAGDRIDYLWLDDHAMHTVGFAADEENLPEPFGFDCGSNPPGYQPVPNVFNTPPPPACLEPGATEAEHIGDPGNAPSGTVIHGPDQRVDSGLLVGRAYGLSPSSQGWSVTIGADAPKGQYSFFCTVHAWMHGILNVN